MSEYDEQWDVIINGLVAAEQQALANWQLALVASLEDQITQALAEKAAGVPPD